MRNRNVKFFIVFGLFFWFVLTPIALISFDYLNYEVLHPAEMSLKFDCKIVPELLKEYNFTHLTKDNLKEINKKISGGYIAGVYNQDDGGITLLDYDITTIKHEICHAQQQEKNRSYVCGQTIFGINGVFLNEAECYWKQNFMNDVNISAYGFDLVGSIEMK